MIDARFKQLHFSVVAFLESISGEGTTEWAPDSITDATTLLLAIGRTEFISAFVNTTESLKYLPALTRSLQAEAKNIVQSVSEINRVKTALQDVRGIVENYHSKWFADVEVMCDSVNIEPCLP